MTIVARLATDEVTTIAIGWSPLTPNNGATIPANSVTNTCNPTKTAMNIITSIIVLFIILVTKKIPHFFFISFQLRRKLGSTTEAAFFTYLGVKRHGKLASIDVAREIEDVGLYGAFLAVERWP